ncbi:MAG TPA: hypothetical protein PLD23_09295 [Armatimonadota bacterium]|nr:hypothetical protein [Armatimonadota bacterium]HQK93688.1 hypothetical protein [Armatimonadota bacterium]
MARAKGQAGKPAPGARGGSPDAAQADSGKPRRGCCLPRLVLALLLTAMVCFVLHTLWIIDLPRVPHLRARPKRKPAAAATEVEKARAAEEAAGKPPGETAGPEPAETGAVELGGLARAGAQPAPAGSSAPAAALKAQEDERKRAERRQQQKQAAIFAALSPQKAAEALAAMPEDQQLQILQALEEKQAAKILEQMPVEKRVRVLTALGEPFAPL